MNNFTEIVDYKSIGRWLLIIAVFFACGYVLKGMIVYFAILLSFYFFIRKQYINQFHLIFVWIYIYEYFNGIGYLPENQIVINTSPFLTLVFLTIVFQGWRQVSTNQLSKKVYIAHVILAFILIISTIINQTSPFKVIRFLLYFLIFIIVFISNFDISVYRNLYNQIFAVGFFQIPIALAQYLQILPAPKFRDASALFAHVEHQLYLDDAACGTFGPASSPDLSLFLTFLSFTFLLQFVITKRYIFLFSGIFLLLQYIVVDSKTVLGVSGLIAGLIILLNGRIRYYLIRVLNIRIMIIATLIVLGFVFGLKRYYEQGLYDDGESKLDDIQEMLEFSHSTFTKYFDEWGKIQGFHHVKELQQKRGGTMAFLFGFGMGEMWYRDIIENKTFFRFFIRGYANHFLDTSSTMISLLAEIGLLGLSMFIIVFLVVLRNYKRYNSRYVLIEAYQYLLPAFIIGVLVYSFINKEMKPNDASIITFWIFLALSQKFRQHEEKLDEEETEIENRSIEN